MAGIGDEVEAGAGPCGVEREGSARRADHIVATLDDGAGDVGDARAIGPQLAGCQPGIMGEVVVLDAGEGQREVRIGKAGAIDRGGQQCGGAALPERPGLRGGEACRRVGTGEAAVVGGDQVVAFRGRDGAEEIGPVVGENLAGAVLVVPVQFGL